MSDLVDDLIAFYLRIESSHDEEDASLDAWLNRLLARFEKQCTTDELRDDFHIKRLQFCQLPRIRSWIDKLQALESGDEERLRLIKQSAREVHNIGLITLELFTQRWTLDWINANLHGDAAREYCWLTLEVLERCEMIGEFSLAWTNLANSVN